MIVQQNIQLNLNNNSHINPHSKLNFKRKKKKKKKRRSVDISFNNNNSLLNETSRDIYDVKNFITKVACLNVRTLSEIRLSVILDYMNTHKIDIMGLVETNISDQEIKYMNCNKYNFRFISHNDNQKPKGKGIVLIIKDYLEKHIYNITTYKGRVLAVNFCFKNHKKLKIILVYNVSGNRLFNEQRIDINTNIIKMIKDAKKEKMELIVFGDFNLQYKKYRERKNKGVYINKVLKFFEKLDNYNLWDVHKEFYDMDSTNEIHTFTGINNSKTRIDYIWVSENIYNNVIDAKIKDFSDDTHLDHRILTFEFDKGDIISASIKVKKYKNKKIVYNYNETDEEKKASFNQDLLKSLESWNPNWSIEEKWKFYRITLEDHKNKYISKSEIVLQSNHAKDFIQSYLYKDLCYIIFLRRQIKKVSG